MDVSVPAVERVRPPRAVVLFGNPVMRLLLRSPLHRLVSGALLLLHFRGRRTGRAYTVPAGYHRIDGQIGVLTNSGWRVNFRGGAGIEVTYRGRRHPARATLAEDPEVVAGVYERLIGHLGVERAQRRLGVRINVDRVPTRAELAEAVRRSGLSILRLDLPPANPPPLTWASWRNQEPYQAGLRVASPAARAHGHLAAVHTWISTLRETTGLDSDKSRAHACVEWSAWTGSSPRGGAMFFDLAVKKPLPEAQSQPRITPRVVIVHTMDGTLLGTDSLFRHQSKFESHFGIGGPTDGADLDGVIFQWMDTDRRADANRRANAFAVSIETSDGGDPSRPWSPKQLDALIRLIGALCDHHRIPRRICDRADGSGLGWHVMFGAPGPWTPVAKTCPGPVRIEQLKNTVFPAVMGHKTPSMTMAPEEDMTGEQARQLEAIFKGLTVQGTSSPEETVNLMFDRIKKIEAALTVPGTTSAEDAFNLLFARVREIHKKVVEGQ